MREKSLFPKVYVILSLSLDLDLTIVQEKSEMEREGAKARERERVSGEEIRLNKREICSNAVRWLRDVL